MILWEIRRDDWREGSHHGTLLGERGLELIPGVSRGQWERTLPEQGPCTHLVASLNPEPWPVGSGVRLILRARLDDGEWSAWTSLGIYGAGHGLPRSEGGQASGLRVDSDLLRFDAPVRQVEVRLEVEAGELGGTPCIRRLALVGWEDEPLSNGDSPRQHPAWGQTLDLQPRSQRTEEGDLATRACSPTSLATVLAYWGRDHSTAEVARAVFDHGAELYGNWSFNVAHAGELGLEATVVRFTSLVDLEAEVGANRPVVISHRYAEGELSDTPLPATEGHLIVVVGFTSDGDLVVHDPAADPNKGEPVRRVYRRAELRTTWLENGAGVAYLIRPRARDLMAE